MEADRELKKMERAGYHEPNYIWVQYGVGKRHPQTVSVHTRISTLCSVELKHEYVWNGGRKTDKFHAGEPEVFPVRKYMLRCDSKIVMQIFGVYQDHISTDDMKFYKLSVDMLSVRKYNRTPAYIKDLKTGKHIYGCDPEKVLSKYALPTMIESSEKVYIQA